MDFLIPVTIDRIRFHPPSRSYAVILEDEPSQRKLPIMIGTYEAQSIAIAIEKKHVTRPMTHDLVTSLLTEFDFRLNSIHINDLIEGVFYARLVVESMDNGHEQNIDCRPSDAIAIAVRMDVPIRVAKHVIDEAGYVEDPISVEEEVIESDAVTITDLENKLDEAVENEDYENAAILRDKIKELFH